MEGKTAEKRPTLTDIAQDEFWFFYLGSSASFFCQVNRLLVLLQYSTSPCAAEKVKKRHNIRIGIMSWVRNELSFPRESIQLRLWSENHYGEHSVKILNFNYSAVSQRNRANFDYSW